MSTAFDRLTAIVASLKTVEDGVAATVDSLVAQVRTLASQVAAQPGAVTEDQLNALADDLEGQKAALAAAVVAGTAAETPAEPPAEPPAETTGDDTASDTTAAPTGDTTVSGGEGVDSLDPTSSSSAEASTDSTVETPPE